MSTHEHDIPPVGEEVHLPGPTLLPVLLTIGLTVTIVGITTSIVLVIAGGALTIGSLIRWIADARREFDELPLEHHH
jgi:hypothetical protein